MDTAELRGAKHRRPFALPPCETTRWVANRKAAVVIAVCDGAISRGIACERYQLSLAELDSWETAFRQYGTNGLRASYRDALRKLATG
jgi:hypothetical protein